MNYFIAVNYGTSKLIEPWVFNIQNKSIDKYEIIIIDNFKNNDEREKVRELSKKLSFILIESENIGYGRGLNKGLRLCRKIEDKNTFNIFAGNLDIIYENIPSTLPLGKYVYVPRIEERRKKNRNPFLTKLQTKIFFIYYIAGFFKSKGIFFIAVFINKLLGLIPSKIWATHGSLFCFNSSCLVSNHDVFNNKSFLYCEELEFASFMEKNKVQFVNSDIKIFHDAHIATKDVVTSRDKFFDIWWPSYKNWYKRWK